MFQEVRAIVRISKNIAILTPLLGLTWGFGIATVINDSSLVFHILFSLLNAFQGFFILVFGTILDPKTLEQDITALYDASNISHLSGSYGAKHISTLALIFKTILDKRSLKESSNLCKMDLQNIRGHTFQEWQNPQEKCVYSCRLASGEYEDSLWC
ncbi:hypothetical protein QTO34_001440 [Cnephaeus nilssonii]|uniref:Uncharacterized protein n=1 Tax=Cnephaeus nilssonii TaxID=3371016 RepID=A0AA40LMB0_CNENI|nr:hypothetical protein QTO34_001440 [Eptesicus nilssonii]